MNLYLNIEKNLSTFNLNVNFTKSKGNINDKLLYSYHNVS